MAMGKQRRRRGRPRREAEPVVVNVKLTLYGGRDDDLIAFFDSLPPRGRAAAVKMAMRSGNIATVLDEALPDDDEVAAALDDLLFGE